MATGDVKLEIQVPIVGSSKYMRLDSGKLSNVSGYLYPRASYDLAWYDLTPYLQRVDSYEGLRTDAPAAPPEPGSLSVQLFNGPALTDLEAAKGTPIRLTMSSPGGYPAIVLWAGWIDKWRDTWDKLTDDRRTSIVAQDLNAVLGSVTRYGSISGNPWRTQTIPARFAALGTSSPIPLTFDTSVLTSDPYSDGIEAVDTVRETDLLSHFHMAATAGLGFLVVNTSTKTIRFARPLDPNGPRRQAFDFTDDPLSIDPSYYSITLSSPGDELNTLGVTQQAVGADGNAFTTTVTVTNDSPVLLYGVTSGALDTVATLDRLDVVGRYYTAPSSAQKLWPEEIEIDGIKSVSYLASPAGTDVVRPLDHLQVTYRGNQTSVLIGAVRHLISINSERKIEHRTILRFIKFYERPTSGI